MENDNSYADLTAQFVEEDQALAPPEEFVASVMQPIYKPSRWRQLFLFGAGGIGLGAAGSQVIGLLDHNPFGRLNLDLSAPTIDLSLAEMSSVSPTTLVIIAMVGCCLAMMAFLERA